MKVGDKVEVIGCDIDVQVKVGDVGILVECYSTRWLVRIDSLNWWINPTSLKICAKQTSVNGTTIDLRISE